MPVEIGKVINVSMSRTGKVLFPYDFKKWGLIAVAGMLSLVGEGGMAGNIPNPTSGRSGGGGGGVNIDEVLQWLRDNLVLFIVASSAIILVVAVIYMIGRWLNSRGRFMFYDNAVHSVGRVKIPWHEYRMEGNSLFKFRLGLDLLVFNVYLVIFAIAVAIAWKDIWDGLMLGEYLPTGYTITAVIFLVVSVLLTLLPMMFLYMLVFNIMVPVMYVRRMQAWPALKHSWRHIFLPNKGSVLIYFIIHIALGSLTAIWGFVAMLALGIFTCCVGLVATVVPVLGNYPLAFLTLPITTFDRVFQLTFLEELGSEYQVTWAEPLMVQKGFEVIMPPPETKIDGQP